jgi:hypothetical protein
MNELIKELSEQAEKYADDNFRGEPTWSEAFESKFAELIVRKCAGVCEDYRGTKWGKAAECIGDSIKEHFGVEP